MTFLLRDLEALAEAAFGPPKGNGISVRMYRVSLVNDALSDSPNVASLDEVKTIRAAAARLGLSEEEKK